VRRFVLECTEEQRKKVLVLAASRSAEARLVQRACIITRTLEGKFGTKIAKELGIRQNTVSYWRHRFAKEGIAGLYDRPRKGKPAIYDERFGKSVLKLLDTKKPPAGMASWDGPTIAKELGVSVDAVWRFLKKEGIVLSRQRSWCVSTDPEFSVKAADIIGLYLNPPENALVVCVDEKPSIQAIERATGYVFTSSGKIVRGLKSTYKRNGTVNLFAALQVATGQVQTKTTERKRRPDFLSFMDDLVAEMPSDKEIYVILDNYCIHKKNDLWLSAHPNVHFHFTPTYASWLNQIEIWFGIFSRKVLKGGNFTSTSNLVEAIEAFVAAYGETAKPFVWRKREVKGSQLRNTIANLCS
jgi:transposase